MAIGFGRAALLVVGRLADGVVTSNVVVGPTAADRVCMTLAVFNGKGLVSIDSPCPPGAVPNGQSSKAPSPNSAGLEAVADR